MWRCNKLLIYDCTTHLFFHFLLSYFRMKNICYRTVFEEPEQVVQEESQLRHEGVEVEDLN